VSFSSDGRRLAFSTCAQNMVIARLRRPQPPELITRPATQDCCVTRLDSKRLLIGSKRSGEMRVWTLDPATGETRVVAPEGSTFNAASPDGKRLVYQGKKDELWIQPLAGGDGRRLTSGHHDSWPQFTFDGRSVLFLRALAEGVYLFIVDAGGGEPRQLLPDRVAALSASRTADRVALLLNGEEAMHVGVTDVASGAVHRLAHIPPDAYQSVRISPDGRRLLVATQTEVFETGLEGGSLISRWKTTVEGLGSVDYTPDGNDVVAELGAYDGDLWLAEGRFR
jgi:Tol biopolymer transport system component